MRKGRVTHAQARALKELWPKFGIETSTAKIDLERLFARDAPLLIEIGFGNGDATWQMARNEPDKNFIGIEVHQPGVGQLLQALESNDLTNVRIAREDAVDFLRDRIPDNSVSELRIYFPDPWPKKRHHKRRIIQTTFLDLLARKMVTGGILHLATDWPPYAEYMLEICNQHPAFENRSPDHGYCPKPDWRPETKYEKRGQRLGQPSRDIILVATNMPGK